MYFRLLIFGHVAPLHQAPDDFTVDSVDHFAAMCIIVRWIGAFILRQ